MESDASITAQFPSDAATSFNPKLGPIQPIWAIADAMEATRHTSSSSGTPRDDRDRDRDGYSFRGILGRGGFGEVLEAEQHALERVVAVKRLLENRIPGASTSEDSRAEILEMFRQEAVITANLEHPNIVPVHDFGRDAEGRPLLAMKLVKGRTWNHLLREDLPRLTHADFLAKHIGILIDVSQAVAFAHSRGVIHRDLKPHQVILGEFGEVILADWGLAIMYDEGLFRPFAGRRALSIVPTLASASCPAGTPCYMAPEQADYAGARLGPWTDIYLLGGTLYQILTGEAPHPGPTGTVAFEQARRGVVMPPARRAPNRDVPPELEAIAMRALDITPERRHPSAREFVSSLQDYLSGASRRREAAEIVARATGELDATNGSYAVLADIETRLARAMTLAPGEPTAIALRERAIAAYANAALANGDLVLAEVQAGRLADPAHREALAAEIDTNRAAQLQRERQRRNLKRTLAAGVAVFLLVTTLLWRNATSQALRADKEAVRANQQASVAVEQRGRAETREAEAREARARAEDLIGFMIGELRLRLSERGLVSLLLPVTQRVLDYYEDRRVDDMTINEKDQNSRAMRALADVFVLTNDLERADAAVSRSLSLTYEVVDAYRAVGRNDLATSTALRQRGNHTLEAHIASRRAQPDRLPAIAAAIEAIPAATFGPVDRLLHVADAGVIRCGYHQTRREWQRALDVANGTIATLRADPDFAGITYAELLRAVATLHAFSGRSQTMLGNGAAAVLSLEESSRIQEALVAREGSSVGARSALADSLEQLSDAYADVGRSADAMQAIRRAADVAEELTRIDGANALYRRNSTRVRSALGTMLLNEGRISEAIVEQGRAIAMIAGDAAARAPESSIVQAYSRAHTARSDAYRAAWRLEESLADASVASRAASAGLARFPRDRSLASLASRALREEGALASLLLDAELARHTLEAAADGARESIAKWPADAITPALLGVIKADLALLALRTNDHDAITPLLDATHADLARLEADTTRSAATAPYRALIHEDIAEIYDLRGDHVAALAQRFAAIQASGLVDALADATPFPDTTGTNDVPAVAYARNLHLSGDHTAALRLIDCTIAGQVIRLRELSSVRPPEAGTVLALVDQRVESLLVRARVHRALGDPTRAEADLTEADALSSALCVSQVGHPQVARDRIDVLLLMGRTDEARRFAADRAIYPPTDAIMARLYQGAGIANGAR